jgi:hypothetical protein
MPEGQIPSSLSVPMSALANLAVEWWRLSASPAAPSGGAAPARHAARRIGDFLKQCEVEIQTLEGRPFDPGLPVRVIDAVDDASLKAGESIIAETLSPIVLWRGQVIKSGDVVTRRGVGNAE